MKTDAHPNCCNICQNVLTNPKIISSFDTFDEDGKPNIPNTYQEAWCSNCEIYLTATFLGKQCQGWSACRWSDEHVDIAVSSKEMEEMESKVKSYDGYKAKEVKENWGKFKSIIKPSDLVFKLKPLDEDEPDDEPIFVIKRGEYFVGMFTSFLMSTKPSGSLYKGVTPTVSDVCSICQTGLKKINHVMSASVNHADGTPGSPRGIIEGWCPQCEIYLYQSYNGKESSEWSPPSVSPEDLAGEASIDDIKEMETAVTNYIGLMDDDVKKNWMKFKKIKKAGDHVYKINYEGVFDGFVLKRGDLFIGKFSSFPIGHPGWQEEE